MPSKWYVLPGDARTASAEATEVKVSLQLFVTPQLLKQLHHGAALAVTVKEVPLG